MTLHLQHSLRPESTESRPSLIHSTVIVTGEVEIADDVEIGAYCVLTGPLRIEAGCRIGTGCVIGGAPEHRKMDSGGPVVIGAGTTLREYCIVHHGTGPRGTHIGSNCYIMNRSYIAHDCQLADDVVISAGVALAGNVSIHQGANLGMLVAVHQFSTIGAYSMIGMSTPISKDVPPFCLAAGNPVHVLRANQHALSRLEIRGDFITSDDYGLIYNPGNAIIDASLEAFKRDSNRTSIFEIRIGNCSSPRKPR